MSRVYSDLVRVVRALTVHLGASPLEKCACDVTPNSSYVKLLGLRIYGFFCGARDIGTCSCNAISVGQCSKACSGLEEVLPDMLELSVLVPSAPWVRKLLAYLV